MELSRASEEEVKSWFTDLRPGKEILNVQSADDDSKSGDSSACQQAPSHKFVTATACIDQVIRKTMQRKRRFDKLDTHEKAEVEEEPGEESKIEAIKKPAAVPFPRSTGHVDAQTLSKAAKKRLKKKQKKAANGS
ncbi:uncharacterized protein LOC144152569 isoform X1 [Haemaphysalis longicornis]